MDPFGLTADTRFYAPRSASERALERLENLVGDERRFVALIGPPGIGKTLLLRVFEERLRGGPRILWVPYPALPPAELCAWALELLGERVPEDPERGLLLRAQSEAGSGSGLLLLVDEASSMPVATARRLSELARESRGALRLVLAAVDDGRADRVFRELDEVERVAFSEPMRREETGDYVAARLAAAGVSPEVWRRFDSETVAALHEASEGIPLRVHELATGVLRRPLLHRTSAARPEARTKPPHRLAPSRPRTVAPKPHPGPRRRDRHALALFALGALVSVTALAILSLRALAPVSPPDSVPVSAAERGGGEASRADAVKPALHPLRVNVNAHPWAEIEIDGVAVGVTPLGALGVLPGPHVFRARLPDGRVLERRVVIGPASRHVTFEAGSRGGREEPTSATDPRPPSGRGVDSSGEAGYPTPQVGP